MTNPKQKSGGELFIVDNSDEDWKVRNYLHQWCDIARSFDIATGYFEIGALLALDGQWQQLEKIRLLMGDEVSKRTKKAFEAGLTQITTRLDDSLEEAKEQDDFLEGVPAIVAAIKTNQIEARVYRKKKFHAKAYITHSKFDVVGSSALVGSSNFTHPGLHQNIDLIRHTDTGHTVIVDFKSSDRAQAEDITQQQLQVYALGYQQLTGQPANLIEVHNLDDGGIDRELINPAMIQKTVGRVENAGRSLRANNMPRLSNWCGTCDKCSMVGICRQRN